MIGEDAHKDGCDLLRLRTKSESNQVNPRTDGLTFLKACEMEGGNGT